MEDSLGTPSMQSGNVLALLNTLYTSGFAMYSPSTPLLKGRTMHTLYAISFIVYVSNCACDWLHVWATLQGLVTSFPVKTWLAVALVITVVGGSMLTWLLLVLCIENAFAHRLDVTPYRSGFALIFEAIIDWIQAFNNFRIAFLVLILHDTPITILNFYFIASCRCAGPNILPWSLLLSASSSIVSVLWRITMLYFAYRRLLCPMRKMKNAVSISRFPTPREHFKWATDISNGGRLSEWDECWPVRWACTKVYETKPVEARKEGTTPISHDAKANYPSKLPPSMLSTLPIVGTALRGLRQVLHFSIFLLLSFMCYFGMLIVCCAPYLYHYTCKRHSFYHRHKCSRSLVRYCSYIFHYVLFFCSLVGAICILSLNIILISSVHILGSNNIPPEIDRVCITLLPRSHSIHASILPSPVFDRNKLEHQVNSKFLHFDDSATTECKPLWEDGGLGLGLRRKEAGPWQTRRRLGDQLIAVATQVVLNNTVPDDAYLELRFDHSLMHQLGSEGSSYPTRTQCHGRISLDANKIGNLLKVA